MKEEDTGRNIYDVALELTMMYYEDKSTEDVKVEDIQGTFLKFYSTVYAARNGITTPGYMKEYLPSELKDLIQR